MNRTRQVQCLGVVQVWEQEVAWTEADKPIMVAARALTLPQDHKLNKTPIFCFETMMHMLYWSCLVYDYKRVREPQDPEKISILYEAQLTVPNNEGVV